MNKLKLQHGVEVRLQSRAGLFDTLTAGQAPKYLQGNVVILPVIYAADFLQYCLNNPKPCPLIGISKPGDTQIKSLGDDMDLRKDIPKYRIFEKGELIAEESDISSRWRDDLVTFILGCSFTFEEALIRKGYGGGVRHIELGCNVPMFRTNIQTIPGGIFSGPMVVTMRPFKREVIPKIYDICSHYPHAHGAPLCWGDPEAIGISDLKAPDYGDAVEIRQDEIPVFWACGVTTQAALSAARPQLCITHAPGHMLVSDILSESVPHVVADMTNFINY